MGVLLGVPRITCWGRLSLGNLPLKASGDIGPYKDYMETHQVIEGSTWV